MRNVVKVNVEKHNWCLNTVSPWTILVLTASHSSETILVLGMCVIYVILLY